MFEQESFVASRFSGLSSKWGALSSSWHYHIASRHGHSQISYPIQTCQPERLAPSTIWRWDLHFSIWWARIRLWLNHLWYLSFSLWSLSLRFLTEGGLESPSLIWNITSLGLDDRVCAICCVCVGSTQCNGLSIYLKSSSLYSIMHYFCLISLLSFAYLFLLVYSFFRGGLTSPLALWF